MGCQVRPPPIRVSLPGSKHPAPVSLTVHHAATRHETRSSGGCQQTSLVIVYFLGREGVNQDMSSFVGNRRSIAHPLHIMHQRHNNPLLRSTAAANVSVGAGD